MTTTSTTSTVPSNFGFGFDGSIPDGTEGPVPVRGSALCIPGVLAIDVSWSMTDHLAQAETALGEFVSAMRRSPQLAEIAQLAIVVFADSGREVLGFSRIADPAVVLPRLQPEGTSTNYHAGLLATHHTLSEGLKKLITGDAQGRRTVNRPSVYWISDGQPNSGGDWRAARAQVKSEKWAPNIFAFGFGQADRDIIRAVADEGCAYFAEDGQEPLAVMTQILRVVLRSLVSVSTAATVGATTVMAPDPANDPATAGLVRLGPVSI